MPSEIVVRGNIPDIEFSLVFNQENDKNPWVLIVKDVSGITGNIFEANLTCDEASCLMALFFANDTLPEDTAKVLYEVIEPLMDKTPPGCRIVP